ncbi:MAG: SpoIIE family protein phosphatase [Spirochaetia bacterium]|nr:SpoIIE family protein phosphatase [Spirochaetia bacterium]
MKALSILAAIFAFCAVGCRQGEVPVTPRVTDGVIDLRTWDFKSDSLLNLEGQWEFYWREFLPPDAGVVGNRSLINVPGQWQNQGFPAYGYATYRVRILLPESTPDLALAMTNAATAYKLYVNGGLHSENGQIGKSESDSVPFLRHATVQLKQIPVGQPHRLDLVFHVSNFHFFQAGLWNTIKLGSAAAVERAARKKFVLDVIVFSSLVTMGFYHLGLYLNRRKDSTPFYFGSFCILMALRTVSLGERLILDAWPVIPFTLVHKLEFFTLYAGASVFTSYIESLFPVEFSRRVSLVMRTIFGGAAIIAVAFPMTVYGHTLLPIQITILLGICYFVYVLVSAFSHRRPGARLFLVGFGLFAVTIIIDILKTLGYLYQVPYSSSYGFLIFIVFQGAVLSRKFARAFTEAENLAGELKLFSEGLEANVKERTRELNATLGTIRLDLSVAKAVQEQSLLVQSSPKDLLEIVPRYLPMSEVGGDFYAVSRVNDHIHRILLADATGHGVQAALITMAIKGFYDNLKDMDVDPGALMKLFNTGFMERYAPLRSFLTALIVDVDTKNRRLQYASAGHPTALVMGNGRTELLDKRGKMIGILRSAEYSAHEVQFAPGSRLYLFTDGIFEEFNQANEEFGENRVQDILQLQANRTLTDSIETVIQGLDGFLNGQARQDDATILGIEFKQN